MTPASIQHHGLFSPGDTPVAIRLRGGLTMARKGETIAEAAARGGAALHAASAAGRERNVTP